VSNEIYLCFDHGEKRIGVAVGQTVSNSASPLETIACKHNKPDWQRISELIKMWRPSAFVVGHPLTMEDERQPATEAAEKFARQLHGRYGLPCHLADERLSSYEAQQQLKNTYNIDPVAAQLILESWMTARSQHENSADISSG
jgi:putative Holliday junction resolvase